MLEQFGGSRRAANMISCKVMHSFLLLCIIILQTQPGENKSTPSHSVAKRIRRQVAKPSGGIDFSNAVLDEETGYKCVMKTEEIETVAKDPILSCVHRNVEKCHYTYITQFTPSQEEKCDENYQKSCQISFHKKALNETIRKCYRPVEKVCNGKGPEECRVVYESSCNTKYVEAQPGKYVGDTACEKLPVEVCGAGCEYQEGAQECHDKVIASVVEVPEEQCDLNPQKICRFVTKLVPSLKPEQQCAVIPQEICTMKSTAPRLIKKPLLTKWCLDDSPVFPRKSSEDQSSVEIPREEPRSLIALGGPFKTSYPIVLNFNGDEFEKPTSSEDNIMDFIIDEFLDAEDILNIADPRETDGKQINKLTKEEQNDLDDFNLGIHLEEFRTRIDNNFQTQDFSQFVDFEEI